MSLRTCAAAPFSPQVAFSQPCTTCGQAFDKWGASSFFQTPLAAYFTRHGVDTVAVCGRIVPLGRKRKLTPRQQTAVDRCAVDTSLNTRELGANEKAAVDRSAAAPPPAACERRFEAAAISVSAAHTLSGTVFPPPASLSLLPDRGRTEKGPALLHASRLREAKQAETIN